MPTLLCAVAAVALISPASASAQDQTSPEATTPLIVTGIDLAVAESAGADIRTTKAGEDVVTFPSGLVLRAKDGIVAPSQRGTVVGNCGTANVAGNRSNRKFSTGYTIYESHGRPGSHVWSVTVSTSNSVAAHNVSGLASSLSTSWNSGWKDINQAGSINSMLASGHALTTFGLICSAGNPTWK
ncbi:hypothetical protein ASF23_11855 [Curtobacterium sp. Leaf261]|nr:hypothetical protein ASF23_11855 [Curtobacterium sp. Leaf261]